MGRADQCRLDRFDGFDYYFIMTAGQGSSGNVIAALASFFIPGLGQLIQGRFLSAVLFFIAAVVLWVFLLGWIMHLWSILDAALWKPKA
ncbi:MAG: DUF6677 family protein [Terrimicrobiaceae bacterium]